MDPYKVLGVSPTATDDEVKKAYRELVKRYHPDRYTDPNEKNAATEKIKQINAAYDQIQAMRKGGGNNYRDNAYYSYSSSSNIKYAQIYSYINAGDLTNAERLLDAMADRDAEWHYLKGILHTRRQWFDAARTEFQTAVGMDPDDARYQQAFKSINNLGGYRNFYGNDGQAGYDPCNICSSILCADFICSCLRCC